MIFRHTVKECSEYSQAEFTHLHNLIFQWDVLADLFVGELYLYLPIESSKDELNFKCAAHVRPTNIVSLHPLDPVGKDVDWQILQDCYSDGNFEDIYFDISGSNRWIQMVFVPVVFEGKTLGVLAGERLNQSFEYISISEDLYESLSGQLFKMVAESNFPYPTRLDMKSGPRVPDGIMKVNPEGVVEFATPNAISAMKRLGLSGPIIGKHLDEFGFKRDAVMKAIRTAGLALDEIISIDHGLSIQVLPIISDGERFEAMVMLRRIFDDIQQDRIELAMDTTIREIHHRVKNNLQTVSSLLQLQARRVTSDQAKDAIADSVRRIRSIAVVHELLSKRGVEQVSLVDIIRPIVALTKSAFVVPDRPIVFKILGDGPTMPETTVSSIGVIITELLQNCLIHGFPEGSSGGTIIIELGSTDSNLEIFVVDDGVGLPSDFDLSTAAGLGLTICKTLVEGDFKGTLVMEPRTDGIHGTCSIITADLLELEP